MHSAKDARIAVLGSEPEIPFYADRHSATGHIYMFGLTEPQPYALDMQSEFIHDVETTQPDYVVFVTYRTSWLQFTKVSTLKILDWWSTYQPQKYKKIVGVADIISPEHTEYRWGDFGTYQVMSDSAVLIYKRTDPAEDEAAALNPAVALQSQKKLEYVAQVFRQVFAITLQPDNYIAYSNLGVILDRQGLHEMALKQFHHSLEIQPDQAIAHYQIGRVFVEMHQYPEAIEEFNQALQYEPANADVHNDLGVALFQMGDFKNAATQFSEEISINPANADARRYLANAQAQLKK
jgi:tetratricopeptide (TPR) repeat protein